MRQETWPATIHRMGLFGSSKRKSIEACAALLRSKLGSGEAEFKQTAGWERIPTGEAEIVMLVTDQRVLWTYVKDVKGIKDIVLDISFKDAVAYLGSEGEGGFVLEAKEPRYRDVGGEETTIALFRLADLGSAVEIVRFIEQSIPPEARNLIPDMEGTGKHESYPSFGDDA